MLILIEGSEIVRVSASSELLISLKSTLITEEFSIMNLTVTMSHLENIFLENKGL